MASKKDIVAGLGKLLASKGIEAPKEPYVTRFPRPQRWKLSWFDSNRQRHSIFCCFVPGYLELIVDFKEIPITEQEVAALGLLET